MESLVSFPLASLRVLKIGFRGSDERLVPATCEWPPSLTHLLIRQCLLDGPACANILNTCNDLAVLAYAKLPVFQMWACVGWGETLLFFFGGGDVNTRG